MLDWIRNKFRSTRPKRSKSRSHSQQGGVDDAFSVNETDDHTIARIDLDKLSSGEREGFTDALADHSGISFFEGTIEHGYTLKSAGNADKCPRCKSETEQMYGQFVYTTQSTPRVMLAPAGYFCLDCSAVIIDESVIKSGIVGKFRFKGVIGMSHDGEDFYGFTTWNGQKPILISDERGNVLGLDSIDEGDSQELARARPPRVRDKQDRKVQKAKKNQRKKNRRRK